MPAGAQYCTTDATTGDDFTCNIDYQAYCTGIPIVTCSDLASLCIYMSPDAYGCEHALWNKFGSGTDCMTAARAVIPDTATPDDNSCYLIWYSMCH
jgi:hypothetical protein